MFSRFVGRRVTDTQSRCLTKNGLVSRPFFPSLYSTRPLATIPLRVSAAHFGLLLRTYATKKQPSSRSSASSSKPAQKKSPSSRRTPKEKKSKNSSQRETAPKKKATRKAKSPRSPKKSPTEAQKLRQKVKKLKQIGLVGQDPKLFKGNAFIMLNTEMTRKGASIRDRMREVTDRYKSLSQSEVQNYKGIAQQRRASSEDARKKWIASHTPNEIRLANNARRLLNRIRSQPLPQTMRISPIGKTQPVLQDPRVGKKPTTPFIVFSQQRWASGDFSNVRMTEATTAIAKEWTALSQAEKQKYIDEVKPLVDQYNTQLATLYPSRRLKNASRSA